MNIIDELELAARRLEEADDEVELLEGSSIALCDLLRRAAAHINILELARIDAELLRRGINH